MYIPKYQLNVNLEELGWEVDALKNTDFCLPVLILYTYNFHIWKLFDLAEDSVIWEGASCFLKAHLLCQHRHDQRDGDDPHCIDEWKWRSKASILMTSN